MFIKRKLAVVTLVFSMVFSIPVSAFASVTIQNTIPQNLDSITINRNSLDATKKDLKEYEKYTADLAQELKHADKSEYSQIIKKFNQNRSCAIREAADELVADVNERSTIEKSSYIVNVDEELKKTYTLNDTETVTITPLYIAEEEFRKDPGEDESKISGPLHRCEKGKNIFMDSAYAANKTKSTGTIYARRTIKSWVGLKIVSVHVQCNFYYNGKSAWYKSNFDSHYERGSGLNPWTCSQWRSKKEKDGSAYTAWARGVFCYGIQYEGNGLIIQETVCKARITCSKTGKITKSYIPVL